MKTHFGLYLIALSLSILVVPGTSLSQVPTDHNDGVASVVAQKRPNHKRERASAAMQQDSGITVSLPKLYDERTLYARFQNLQNALLSMGTFYNQGQVAQALGNIQGSNASISQQQINATVQLPTNAFNSSRTATTGKPTTDTSTSTVNQTAPTIPALQTIQPATGLSPLANIGLSSTDLLAQQTSLNYQLVNLTLLLDRSVSDRVSFKSILTDNTNSKDHLLSWNPRLQAVVGFNISVLPKYENAIAEVEVRVTRPSTKETSADDHSERIVALLPQENTYNVASYTNTTQGFSAGTVFQFLGLSAAGSQSNASLYLARDVDTVAFQRLNHQSGDDGGLDFGWQFRPVLKRSSVDPGTRQVFAVISLPVDDETYIDYTTSKSSVLAKNQCTVSVQVYTAWRKYNPKNGIVGDYIGVPRNVERTPSHEEDLNIYPSLSTQLALAPRVDSIEMKDLGNGNIEEFVTGYNFYPGTSIVSNGTTTGGPNSFQLLSEHRLSFVIPATALLHSSPTIAGPFGDRTFVVPSDSNQQRWNLVVNDKGDNSYIESRDSQTSRVHITLGFDNKAIPKQAQSLVWQAKPDELFLKTHYEDELSNDDWVTPIVANIGGQVFGLADQPFLVNRTAPKQDEVNIEFDVPTQLLRTSRRIVIQPLLYDNRYAAQFVVPLDDDFIVSSAMVIPVDPQFVDVVLLGVNLVGKAPHTKQVTVIANGLVITDHEPNRNVEITDHLLRFRMNRNEALGLSNLIVYRNNQAAQTITLSTPSQVTAFAAPVQANEDPFITVTGYNLSRVVKATFDGTDLTWSYDPVKLTGKVKLTKDVTKDVTAKTTTRTLVFTLDDGTYTVLNLTVNNATTTPDPTTAATNAKKVQVETGSAIVGIASDVAVLGTNLDQIVSATIAGTAAGSGNIYKYDPVTKQRILKITAKMAAKKGVLKVVFQLKDKTTINQNVAVVDPPKPTTSRPALPKSTNTGNPK